MIRYSLIIPVYKNELNIPDLLPALQALAQEVGPLMEVVFVVDGSPDRSFPMLAEALPTIGFPAQLLAHSRNFGSFAAIRTGMVHARGQLVAAMAADLQEPPELIREFFALLDQGEVDLVLGQRTGRADPLGKKLLSQIYWALYRRLVLKDIPPGGVDVFACNDRVRRSVLAIDEPHGSLVAQLLWVGFTRRSVPYIRRPRLKGKSSWGFRRRLRYMLDSIFGYTDLPVLLLIWLGLIGLGVSVLLGVVTLIGRMGGWIEEAGYTTQLLVTLFLNCLTLLAVGVVGLYTWRAGETAKRRPSYLLRDHRVFQDRPLQPPPAEEGS